MVRTGFSLPEMPSRLALSRHLSGEQKCSLHKGRPRRHRIQRPSSLGSPRSQWPLSRQPQPWGSATLPRLPRYYNPLNLRPEGRGGEECTGDRNKEEKLFYPKATTAAHQEGPVPQCRGRGARAEPGPVQAIRGQIAGKQGTRLCPPLSKIIKDYACKLWERGCPAGAEGRGSKMRRRSNTT